LEPEEVCGGSQGCGRTFSLPAARRNVVSKATDGAFSAIAVLEEDVEVGDLACEFQIGVGDLAVQVGSGNQLSLDGQGKGRSPNERMKEWVG